MPDGSPSFQPLEAGPALTRMTTAVGERILRARLASGLTATQLQALRLAHDGPTMSSLSSALGLSKSTLTSVVDQLVAAQMALRAADPADGRRQVVRSTELGISTLARFDADITDAVTRVVATLPDASRARLADLLSRVPDPSRPIPLG